MLKRLRIPLFLFALLSGFALAQNIADDTANAPRPVKLVPAPPAGPVYIRCGALFGGKSDQLERDVVIVVERDRITQVGKLSPPAGAQVIDLANLTCLPGMVESHTHVFLQGDRKPGQYDATAQAIGGLSHDRGDDRRACSAGLGLHHHPRSRNRRRGLRRR